MDFLLFYESVAVRLKIQHYLLPALFNDHHRLVVRGQNGFDTDFEATNLDKALKIRNTKNIKTIESSTSAPTGTPVPTATTGRNYIGNVNSNVFHYPDCSSAKRMSEDNKVYFNNVTRAEVIAKGYTPCGNCEP